MQVTAKNNQSLFDMAVQTLGSAEAIFDIAIANGISITDDLTVGQTLQITHKSDYSQRRTAAYYSINGIMPATAISLTEDISVLQEGIEFWAVELDFIVS